MQLKFWCLVTADVIVVVTEIGELSTITAKASGKEVRRISSPLVSSKQVNLASLISPLSLPSSDLKARSDCRRSIRVQLPSLAVGQDGRDVQRAKRVDPRFQGQPSPDRLCVGSARFTNVDFAWWLQSVKVGDFKGNVHPPPYHRPTRALLVARLTDTRHLLLCDEQARRCP